MKQKPDSITTEQYRELIRLLKNEGWAMLNFGELKKDEVWLLHNNGIAQRVKYEDRRETLRSLDERH